MVSRTPTPRQKANAAFRQLWRQMMQIDGETSTYFTVSCGRSPATIAIFSPAIGGRVDQLLRLGKLSR
ncbi:hypothetical protein XI08_08040 [Bradyrhizobium sp. CCBAU 11361]|nr:hypothetical protein [Bradyrhizobium sp. CCBAU 11361]